MNKPDFEPTRPMERAIENNKIIWTNLFNQVIEVDPEPEEHLDPQTGVLSGFEDFITDIDCMDCGKKKLTYGEYIYVGICSDCAQRQMDELKL
jgi:hypothetical protein